MAATLQRLNPSALSSQPSRGYSATCTRISLQRIGKGARPMCEGRRVRLILSKGACLGASRTVCRAGMYDPFGHSSPFSLMDRQLAELDRQMDVMQQQVDRDFDSMFSDIRNMESQARQQAEQARQQAAELADGRGSSFPRSLPSGQSVSVQRSEQRGPGSYAYYESIQITSDGARAYSYTTLPSSTAAAAAGGLSSGALLALAAACAAYVATSLAFMRNYHLTVYGKQWRWPLAALWPLLLPLSARFRQQFWAAVRGQQAATHGRRESDTGSSSSPIGDKQL